METLVEVCKREHPLRGEQANWDDISTQCRDGGGTRCDLSGSLSVGAAQYVARGHGFSASDVQWAVLRYDATFKAPVWIVVIFFEQQTGLSRDRVELIVHAVQGNVLGQKRTTINYN